MKKDSWLIVANSSLARIFKLLPKHELQELKIFEHPQSRLHNQDLVSDKPGKDFEMGGSRRHALEPKTTAKHQEFVSFAKELADYLEKAQERGDFSSLYIAASPALLGLFRESLNPNTAKLIKGETDKDVTHMKISEIPSLLPFFK